MAARFARRCRTERRDELLDSRSEQLALGRRELCVIPLELRQPFELGAGLLGALVNSSRNSPSE